MGIPVEMLEPVSLIYQAVKKMAIELVMECHDPDYEATLENIRRSISKAEEVAFQLTLFDNEDIHPRVSKALA